MSGSKMPRQLDDTLAEGADILYSISDNISPLMLCNFVHANSWHNFWEHGISDQPDLQAKSQTLWNATSSYRDILAEIAGTAVSSDPNNLWSHLIAGYLSRSNLCYMECGHRAIAVSAMAEYLDIPFRHVTLYGNSETTLTTHHVVELYGCDGWEFHDPDYGFCIRDGDRTLSIEEIVSASQPPKMFFEYPGQFCANGGGPLMLVANGFFACASVKTTEQETLYLGNSPLRGWSYNVSGTKVDFVEYWKFALAERSECKIVIS